MTKLSYVKAVVIGLYICEENFALKFLEDKYQKVELVFSQEEHVGKRMYDAIKSINPDFVIKISGDQMFLDIKATNEIIKKLTLNGDDVYLTNFTNGRLPEIITMSVLNEYSLNFGKYDRYYKFVLDNKQKFAIKMRKKSKRRSKRSFYQLKFFIRNERDYNITNKFLSKGFKKFEVILVYSLNKTGSSTISKSLSMSNINYPIYHIHHLSLEGINKSRNYLTSLHKPNLTEHYYRSLFLREHLNNKTLFSRYKIISLVRDPISIAISAFFHNINRIIPKYNAKIRNNSLQLEELKEYFFKRLYLPGDYLLTWFDTEIKDIFGIDVYAYEFSRDRGYQIYCNELADLMVIKLDNLKKCHKEAFKQFLNIEDFKLNDTNVAFRKEYYDIYQYFINSIELPLTYIDDVYSSKFVKHFYSEDEILKFRNKWLHKG